MFPICLVTLSAFQVSKISHVCYIHKYSLKKAQQNFQNDVIDFKPHKLYIICVVFHSKIYVLVFGDQNIVEIPKEIRKRLVSPELWLRKLVKEDLR